MFDKFETFNINGQSIDINRLSVEDLKKNFNLLDEKEKNLIIKQNELISQMIG